MYRAKLSGFAIACMIGLVGLSPSAALASEKNTESATLSQANQNQKENRAAFDEKMKKAHEKWNALSSSQKDEVYKLIENEMIAEGKLMDKLSDLGVMGEDDANHIKAHMAEKFKKLKENGEFPLSRAKKSSKQK